MKENELRELKRLKFKYGEYLIGDYKDQDQLIDYLKASFKLEDISHDRQAILSLDRLGFIRQEIFQSPENQLLKIPKNQLELSYFILEKQDNRKEYFEDDQDLVYLVFSRELENFTSNSDLLLTELIISQGVKKKDIAENNLRLLNFLRAMDRRDDLELISSINPNFISPDQKKMILERYILEILEEL